MRGRKLPGFLGRPVQGCRAVKERYPSAWFSVFQGPIFVWPLFIAMSESLIDQVPKPGADFGRGGSGTPDLSSSGRSAKDGFRIV
jgi:hypothetical protein